MPARKAPAPSLSVLSENVPKIFEQVQVSTANHQKNFVALNKLHHQAAAITESIQNGQSIQLTGEKVFEDMFIDMVLRVLPLKKGANVVDRIVKFVAGYVKFVNDKGTKTSAFTNPEGDLSQRRIATMMTRLRSASPPASPSTCSRDSKQRTRMFDSGPYNSSPRQP